MNRTGSGPRYSPSTWQADGIAQRTKREGLSRTRTWREAACFPRRASRANFAIGQRPFRRRADDGDGEVTGNGIRLFRMEN